MGSYRDAKLRQRSLSMQAVCSFRLAQVYSQEKWTILNEVLGVEQGSEVPAQEQQCVSKC